MSERNDKDFAWWFDVCRVVWSHFVKPCPYEALDGIAQRGLAAPTIEAGAEEVERGFRDAAENCAFHLYGAP